MRKSELITWLEQVQGDPEVDPGIFFFLADGTMVETSFDYIIADKPIQAVNVPLLGQ